MDRELQLQRAKSLAITFLHLPISITPYSPLAILHPFFESGFLYDQYDGEGLFNALEDTEKYKNFIKSFSEKEIEPCESVDDLLLLVRKSYRLTYLYFLQKENTLTKRECGNLLGEHWTLIENLSVDTNVRKITVLSWIKAADKEGIMSKDELCAYRSLPDTITVYRGCQTVKALKGISWTLSEEKARWFASRFSVKNNSLTYRAQICKEDVICYFAGRGEQEIVLDYRKLKDITLI